MRWMDGFLFENLPKRFLKILHSHYQCMSFHAVIKYISPVTVCCSASFHVFMWLFAISMSLRSIEIFYSCFHWIVSLMTELWEFSIYFSCQSFIRNMYWYQYFVLWLTLFYTASWAFMLPMHSWLSLRAQGFSLVCVYFFLSLVRSELLLRVV